MPCPVKLHKLFHTGSHYNTIIKILPNCPGSNVRRTQIYCPFLSLRTVHCKPDLLFSPIYTLGTTYVDDSAPRKSAPVYVSIVYLIGAIGPAAGYILGGVVVTLWVDPLDEAKVTSNDSRWVGQWWLGFLIASLMLFITGLN